jgi:hypothetical protein
VKSAGDEGRAVLGAALGCGLAGVWKSPSNNRVAGGFGAFVGRGRASSFPSLACVTWAPRTCEILPAFRGDWCRPAAYTPRKAATCHVSSKPDTPAGYPSGPVPDSGPEHEAGPRRRRSSNHRDEATQQQARARDSPSSPALLPPGDRQPTSTPGAVTYPSRAKTASPTSRVDRAPSPGRSARSAITASSTCAAAFGNPT